MMRCFIQIINILTIKIFIDSEFLHPISFCIFSSPDPKGYGRNCHHWFEYNCSIWLRLSLLCTFLFWIIFVLFVIYRYIKHKCNLIHFTPIANIHWIVILYTNALEKTQSLPIWNIKTIIHISWSFIRCPHFLLLSLCLFTYFVNTNDYFDFVRNSVVTILFLLCFFFLLYIYIYGHN